LRDGVECGTYLRGRQKFGVQYANIFTNLEKITLDALHPVKRENKGIVSMMYIPCVFYQIKKIS
jgi:hypothetical protein